MSELLNPENSTNNKEPVVLEVKSLKELFELDLRIPDYQRIYCWLPENVYKLLDDIQNLKFEYRLGTIILQKKEDKEKKTEYYDIIDGQQRLVTLALILFQLNQESAKNISLLNQKFKNNEACNYISYNNLLIKNYIEKFKEKFNYEFILDRITFNILILRDSSLDLAYTFFSNENSRGCPLTDFDLLKAHHLRYMMNNEAQAEHMSKLWDDMLRKEQDKTKYDKSYERCLGIYIFRLRKWMNFETWDDNADYRIKKEYEAADTIPQIPAFGEKMEFKEKIQGGSHFFAFVSIFERKYNDFIQLPQYDILHKSLINESHALFRDVIETLLFGYYLKFGVNYLSEALLLIMRIVSQPRYEIGRIRQQRIFEYVNNQHIVNSIDISTSPTFFLADMVKKIKCLSKDLSTPIKRRYDSIVNFIKVRIIETKSLLINDLEGIV